MSLLRVPLLLLPFLAVSAAAQTAPEEPSRPQIRRAFYKYLVSQTRGDPDRMVDLLVRVKAPSPEAGPDEALPALAEMEAAVTRASQTLASSLAPPPGQLPDLLPGLKSDPVLVDNLWTARCLHVRVPVSALQALVHHPSVDGIFENIALSAVPADELAGHASAVVTRESMASWGQGQIKVERARRSYGVDGTGMILGQIDTGVDASHPALVGRVLRFKDFVNGHSEPYDDDGHGTHTAGIMVGKLQGMGVAPGAKLLVAKALDRRGSGSLANLLKAMQWMLDPDGNRTNRLRPVAINNSWGVRRSELADEGFEDTLFWEAIRAWRAAGIVPVFSSGNERAGTVLVPGAYPVALAVGATDTADQVATFSSSGRTDWQGWAFFKPDLVAPGVAIPSAYPGGRVAWMSGTSMACPHVTGLVALSSQLRPKIPVRERERIVLDSVRDLGTAGRGQRSGEGRLDVEAALRMTAAYRPPASPPRAFAPVYMRARRFRLR